VSRVRASPRSSFFEIPHALAFLAVSVFGAGPYDEWRMVSEMTNAPKPCPAEPRASPSDVSTAAEQSSASSAQAQPASDTADFSDMLQELRVLLQGVQMLTGFLVILPFAEGFGKLTPSEKWVYFATFFCSLGCLVLFSAPAAHRILTPLEDRIGFKRFATRMTIAGLVPLSAALVLATHLVVSESVGRTAAHLATIAVSVLIATVWWLAPYWERSRRGSRLRHAGHP